jgi:hypothetical protein
MEFVEHIRNQVDVPRFLKLKGLNINDPVQREQLNRDGIRIKEYFDKKDKQIQDKKNAHRKVLDVFGSGIKKVQHKAAFITA